MLNLIRKLKSHSSPLSSAPKFFLLRLNQFSSSNAPIPISENSNQDSFAATYLRNALGFSPERALLYSKRLNFDSAEKPDSVIAFFKNHYFTDAQFSLMARKWPLVFGSVPESNFLPKIQFLRSLGFSSSNIARVLTCAPRVLERSLEAQIIPCVDFLRTFLSFDKDLVYSILRYPDILRENLQKTLLPNVEALRGAGLLDYQIGILLKIGPRSIAMDPKGFGVTVEEVLKLGLNPHKRSFLDGIVAMRQLSSSSWKEKIDHYKRWGWSEHQVLDIFRRHPRFMMVSKDKSSKIMDFFTNQTACGVSVLFSRPEIFSLSFVKTIAPRCELYRFLLTKGLIKEGCSLGRMLKCPERLFLGRYLLRFEKEAPELLGLYREILSKSK